jgi:hypothetical protein
MDVTISSMNRSPYQLNRKRRSRILLPPTSVTYQSEKLMNQSEKIVGSARHANPHLGLVAIVFTALKFATRFPGFVWLIAVGFLLPSPISERIGNPRQSHELPERTRLDQNPTPGAEHTNCRLYLRTGRPHPASSVIHPLHCRASRRPQRHLDVAKTTSLALASFGTLSDL